MCGCHLRLLRVLSSGKERHVSRPDKNSNHSVGSRVERTGSRMNAGIYFPLFLVLVCGRKSAIYYLSADVQKPEMIKPKKPLSLNARRSGWQGFLYLLKNVEQAFVRIC